MTSFRVRGVVTLASALALLVAGTSVPGSTPASLTPAIPLVPIGGGVDISFPQCIRSSHAELPANVPFAVIGVNGGVASKSNPCFSSEYSSAALLAGASNQPRASVYVNTGNPALTGTWWPTSDHTQAGTTVVNPNGPCQGLAGAECAYVYGYSMAQADYRRVRTTLVRVPGMWWLDVETSNTWQPDVVANAADLSGMVTYFESQQLEVGVYSTSYQWNRIAGATPASSNLAGLPSWLAGGSFAGAPADCERSPLTPNGSVAMVQYVMQLDYDYPCRHFGVATARISPGYQAVVGSELTAVSGPWGPGDVTYSYQWNRDGSAIPGATARTYVAASTDADAELTVTITGLELGFSAKSITSNAVDVVAPPVAMPG